MGLLTRGDGMDSTVIVAILITVAVVGGVLVFQYLQRRGQMRAWQEVAAQSGLACEGGSLLTYPTVKGIYRGRELEMYVHRHTTGAGKNRRTSTSTRIAMTVDNPAGLRLDLSEEKILGRIGKQLGMQDIQVGDAEIDRRFMIKGEPAEAVGQMFMSETLRQKLLALPSLNLELNGTALRYEKPGAEKKAERLTGLFELMDELAAAVERAG